MQSVQWHPRITGENGEEGEWVRCESPGSHTETPESSQMPKSPLRRKNLAGSRPRAAGGAGTAGTPQGAGRAPGARR